MVNIELGVVLLVLLCVALVGKEIKVTLDDIKAKLATLTAGTASIIALVQDLAQYIRDHANDPVKLQEIADEIDADAAAIAAAVEANPVPTP